MKTAVRESSINNWYGGMYRTASNQAQTVLGLMKPETDYTGREMVELLQARGYTWAVPGTVSRIFQTLRDMPGSVVKRKDMARKCRVSGVTVDVHFIQLPVQASLFQ